MELSDGRVIFASRNSYIVLSDDNREYISVLSGSFSRHNDSLPVVGDYVQYYQNNNGDSVIEGIHPRKSSISRKTAGRDFSENVMAANIDLMLIISAMDRTFSVRRLERFLVLARSGGVTPVILLSKADLCPPLDRSFYLYEAEKASSGVKVIEISSVTEEGMEDVRELLREGVTACAVGLSGAGKSTLLNRLCGEELRSVQSVRESDGRGRHTTTSRQMFRLPSGAMFIDSPGIREVGLTGETDAVEEVFDEIHALSGGCFFADCSHVHEPGCAVLKALEAGEISGERYASFLKLRKESENYRMRTEAPQEKKRADKNLSRLVKSAKNIKRRF